MSTVAVYCSICKEKIATAKKEDLRPPMMGSMFLSQDEFHGYLPPFAPGLEWEWMKCPHCRWRPFPFPDRLEIATAEEEARGTRTTYYLPTEAQDEVEASIHPALEDKADQEAEIPEEPEEAWEDALLTCETCGKQYNRVQMALHRKNHKRSDRRREQRQAMAR
jgi:hypothetical protein